MPSRPSPRRYTGSQLDRVAYPMGGIGAGMLCLDGAGSLSHLSFRHKPDVFSQPIMFGALHIKGDKPIARVIQGPVPGWKIMHPWSRLPVGLNSGNGGHGLTYGLPRFEEAAFSARFPFGACELTDGSLPVSARITGWSPFLPGESDDSCLPVAALEYTVTNTSGRALESVFSFHAENVMRFTDWGTIPADQRASHRVRPIAGGFVLEQDGSPDMPRAEAAFAVTSDAPEASVDCLWFRGGWFDPLTMVWRNVERGNVVSQGPANDDANPSRGGSIYSPLSLAAGESKTITIRFSWYAPNSSLRYGLGEDDKAAREAAAACCGGEGCAPPKPAVTEKYKPWYATRFGSVDEVSDYWTSNYARLREGTQRFTDCFYDTTLPEEVVDAVASNLTILKSPTILRQEDGRIWAWEGCCDERGCCHGSCTHVWNYAQSLPHLFPDLERTLRATEFDEDQREDGHQNFRACLPIRPAAHNEHAAADGQLGGIMKVYRDWRISGDTSWLRRLWPAVRQSLEYCIGAWDPEREGALREPHHNTYDIEFWGPDGMCNSFYLGALHAAVLMGEALGEDVGAFAELRDKAKAFLEGELFDGEYFIQKIQWQGLRAGDPVEESTKSMSGAYSPEAAALLETEGPKYQYGIGCLSDGVLGDWIARACGLPGVVDEAKTASHLASIFKYNFRKDLFEHPNPQRPTYAMGHEAGLLLCSWPKGGEPSLPFVYSNEVWTGIEYQVAAHLIMTGQVDEALTVVRALRSRYDGTVRNPFNEYECGHWYARAMASYGLLQAMTGQWYDAVEKVLYLRPQVDGDFRSFLATATGYGTVGMRDGEPFLDVVHGEIPCERVEVLSASAVSE